MNTRSLAFWFFALGLFGSQYAASMAVAATPTVVLDHDRIVVLMSVDGLANFYMEDSAAEMPTIRKLASDGAKAASMRASDPTVTWPNHTTLVTGVSPALHGVVGNNYLDRVTGEKVTLIWDPVFDKDAIVKVPTIYDLAKAAGLKTAAIRWPATRNAHSLDWCSPDVGLDELVLKYTTPVLLEECKEAGLVLIQSPDGTGKVGNQTRQESIAEDQTWTQVFNMVLHKHRPNLALMHVVAIDHTEHSDGPRSEGAYETIKAADDQVRQVWEQLQRDFPEKATLIIVSDHGFSANQTGVLPNVILRDAGLVEATGNRVTGGAVQIVAQGGSAMVYVLDDANRESIIQQIKKAFASVDGVAKVVGVEDFPEYGIANPRRDPHAPDLMLFAKLGYYFGDTAAGTLPHDVKPERKGSHGHDSHLPDLRAVFIACGAGIKPGAQLGDIDNKSVAPMIATLLGFEIPNAEGKPLSEALAE